MSRSRFDGGTLGNGRWDEEEHPRDKDGRFTSSVGSVSSSVSKEKAMEDAMNEEESMYRSIKNDEWESAKSHYKKMCESYEKSGNPVSESTKSDLEDVLRKKNKNLVDVDLSEY